MLLRAQSNSMRFTTWGVTYTAVCLKNRTSRTTYAQWREKSPTFKFFILRESLWSRFEPRCVRDQWSAFKRRIWLGWALVIWDWGLDQLETVLIMKLEAWWSALGNAYSFSMMPKFWLGVTRGRLVDGSIWTWISRMEFKLFLPRQNSLHESRDSSPLSWSVTSTAIQSEEPLTKF